MTSLLMGLLALFTVVAVGPALVRLVLRIVRRVPILGAVAALAVLFWVESPQPSPPPTVAASAPHALDAPVRHRAWSPDDPRVAHTADEDLADVYRSERRRYAAEVQAAGARVRAWFDL